MRSHLGNSYRFRYERFGDVKDIDSAIRQQSKVLASLPRDSTHQPRILMNFGNAYLCRFEWFEEKEDLALSCKMRFGRFGKEDIDSAIKQQLELVAFALCESITVSQCHFDNDNGVISLVSFFFPISISFDSDDSQAS